MLTLILQHAVFMHAHHMAHLDISIRNLLTDYNSHYAYIDFETTRRFDSAPSPRICGSRGTNLSPELERGEWTDPYKADVWSLGVLILKACAVCFVVIPLWRLPNKSPTAHRLQRTRIDHFDTLHASPRVRTKADCDGST